MPRRNPSVFCVAQGCAARNIHIPACVNNSCRGCAPRRAQHPARLCRFHEHSFRDNLRDIPKLYHDLATALIPPDLGMQPRVSGGNFKSNAFPFNDAAAQMRQRTQQILSRLAITVALRQKINPPDKTDVSTLCAYIYRHTRYIVESPTIARHASMQVNKLVRDARRAAYPSGTRIIDIGPCPHLTRHAPNPAIPYPHTTRCPGIIRARMRRMDSLLPSEVVCSQDNAHNWSPRQWLRLRKQLEGGTPATPVVNPPLFADHPSRTD